METNFFRSIQEPKREGLTWEELWKSADSGLITCWERGRHKAIENPELSECCKNGELPVLAWKGGVKKKIKGRKYGSLFYLATWQGLRGEDLNISLQEEKTIICARTQVQVLFTPNLMAYEALITESLEE